jgi:hypothetical protein
MSAEAEWRKVRAKSEATKTHIGFRLSSDVVAAIKGSGKGYNVRVDEALREVFLPERDDAKLMRWLRREVERMVLEALAQRAASQRK